MSSALRITTATLLVLAATTTAGCAAKPASPMAQPSSTMATMRAPVIPAPWQLEGAAKVGIGERELSHLLTKPLYEMLPKEVDRYLRYLTAVQPSLRARVADLARKNIGQPYELYLLGEFPFEVADDQPLFSLAKSDCVVFVEHTYAMALSSSWDQFFWTLQRIRYRGGVIGVETRNHYTEVDWDRENAWLVTDVSRDLAGDQAATYELKVDRERFFKTRYKLDTRYPVEVSTETYVPKSVIGPELLSRLNEGDFVNIISEKTTTNGETGERVTDHWASHVGLVVVGANGERHLLHSSEPVVREETFDSFMRRAAEREAKNAAAGKNEKVLSGFKFLRLDDAPEIPPMQPQPRPIGR